MSLRRQRSAPMLNVDATGSMLIDPIGAGSARPPTSTVTPPYYPPKASKNLKNGGQRVVRSILQGLLDHPPAGYRVEPIYATANNGYHYARGFTLRFLECQAIILPDTPVEFQSGDLFLGLYPQPQVAHEKQDFYQQLRNHGVQVQFVVFDLLPIFSPTTFPAGAKDAHQAWLMVVAESDGAICISQAVSDQLKEWLRENGPTRQRKFKISWLARSRTKCNTYGPKGPEVMNGQALQSVEWG